MFNASKWGGCGIRGWRLLEEGPVTSVAIPLPWQVVLQHTRKFTLGRSFSNVGAVTTHALQLMLWRNIPTPTLGRNLTNAVAVHTVPHRQSWKNGVHYKKFFGQLLVWGFAPQIHCSNLKTMPYLPGWTFFCDFFMWFFLWFCKSVLVKMLPQNIQFLKILKSLVF